MPPVAPDLHTRWYSLIDVIHRIAGILHRIDEELRAIPDMTGHDEVRPVIPCGAGGGIGVHDGRQQCRIGVGPVEGHDSQEDLVMGLAAASWAAPDAPEPNCIAHETATVFFPHTVVGLNTHADLSSGILSGHPLAEQDFSFPQMMDDLLRGASLCRHDSPPSRLPNPSLRSDTALGGAGQNGRRKNS